MYLFKSLGIGAFTLLVILAIISISLPKSIHIQRDIVIHAPVNLAYDQLSDLRNWPKWMPGYHKDFKRNVSYAGTTSVASTQHNWTSQRAGIKPGTVKIVEIVPRERLVTNLEFDEDDIAHSTFTLIKVPEGTKLTWHLDKYVGDNPIKKFSALLLDSTIGEEFEDGLENLKREVEAQYLLTDN